MYLIRGVILLLLSISLVQTRSIKKIVNVTSEETVNNDVSRFDSVSAIIERENKNTGKMKGDFTIIQGDIAVYTGLQNADPCVSSTCSWPRNKDKNVYVPYVISTQYSPAEKKVIQSALDSFQTSTCIRFIPRTNETDYLNIFSGSGCYSSVGRDGEGQDLSLERPGCVYFHVIQHELLHALGFHHEQSRSDRDQHVKILFQNIEPDAFDNFMLEPTLNFNTPYDYNSIMQYGRCAFSKNKLPTIIPKPDPHVPIGLARQMSNNDILRVNRLYCP